jgi:integrase
VRDKYWPVAKITLCPQWAEVTEHFLRLIEADLGDTPLNAVSVEQAERWWANLRRRYSSPVTPNKVLTRIKHIYRAAIRWKYTTNDPFSEIKRVREPERPFERISDSQYEKVYRSAPVRLAPYILFARYTGARRGSLAKLIERDVQISVEQGRKHGEIVFRKTKNGEDHVLPLHHHLIEWIEAHRTGDPTHPLLPQYKSVNTISRVMRRHILKCGLRMMRIHDYRHELGSRLGDAGNNVKVIQQTLGHRDVRMSVRYTHPSRATIESALEAAVG